MIKSAIVFDKTQCLSLCMQFYNCPMAILSTEKRICSIYRNKINDQTQLVDDYNSFIYINKIFQIKSTFKTVIRNLTGHTSGVLSLALLQNADLSSGGSSLDLTIKTWNLNGITSKFTTAKHPGAVRSLVVLPNGELASSSADSIVRI